MSCETFREALSARLDGETGPLPDAEVDAHVDECAACRSWYAEGTRLRRSMVVRAAPPVPDLTAAILENAPPPRRDRWGPRVALAVVALAQCGLAFAQLLGVPDLAHGAHGALTAGHLGNESAAWNLAIGVGLLWAALRTTAAAGQLPVIGGFVLVLAFVSAGDLIGDRVGADRVLSHGVVLAGLILLYVVHRGHRELHRPGPARARAGGGDAGTGAGVPDHPPTSEGRPRGRGPFPRPAGRHRAA
ncbi:hypothetical protein CFN78_12645 [Amycolatopsis antarctica]|uniref:Putative zinc-finger domain-containing protein n=1 Tax=Amycolatopsis antarctica TaxID=1854586 RepID=A0A263D3X0_9PSEU|nr:zf-HC2 domain-containing protein [Amycolatopsis antarctica]OZM73061.1 hypothetical protein CFN78_12645 [Amycolatopsis antarctica]